MLAATGNEKYLKGFGPRVDGFDQVPFNNLNAVRDAIGPHTAGIMVEPVQGEGGIRPGGVDFLRGLRAACDEFGLILGFDEVQCGMGRTGKLFALEWAGIAPDVMPLGQGPRRRLPDRRDPGRRSTWRRRSRPARTAPPSAATRWPAPPPTRCWTSCWPPASSTR